MGFNNLSPYFSPWLSWIEPQAVASIESGKQRAVEVALFRFASDACTQQRMLNNVCIYYIPSRLFQVANTTNWSIVVVL